MKKLFCTLWFIGLAVVSAYSVGFAEKFKAIMLGQTPDSFEVPIMFVWVFIICASPWSYIYGTRISFDIDKSLNGLVDSIKIGFIITLLTQITFVLVFSLLSKISFSTFSGVRVLLGVVMLAPLEFIGQMYISALIAFPSSIVFSTILWFIMGVKYRYSSKSKSNLQSNI